MNEEGLFGVEEEEEVQIPSCKVVKMYLVLLVLVIKK